MADSLAGESRTVPGSANTAALIRAANHHDGQVNLGENGNRIKRDALPLWGGELKVRATRRREPRRPIPLGQPRRRRR